MLNPSLPPPQGHPLSPGALPQQRARDRRPVHGGPPRALLQVARVTRHLVGAWREQSCARRLGRLVRPAPRADALGVPTADTLLFQRALKAKANSRRTGSIGGYLLN